MLPIPSTAAMRYKEWAFISSLKSSLLFLQSLSSTTPPVLLPPPTPLGRSQPGTVEPFDMISALLGVCVKV